MVDTAIDNTPAMDGGTELARSWRRRTWHRCVRLVFGSSPIRFCVAIFAVAIVRTGIWYIPTVDASVGLAADPFSNPLTDGRQDHLLYNWLGPFVAWMLQARTRPTFLILHLVFTVAGSALLCVGAFRKLPDRAARIAIVVFVLLPASTTAYYWVGTDSLTVLLLIACFALPRRPSILFVLGVLLGMQHATVGLLAMGGVLVAALLLRPSSHLDLRSGPAVASVAGVGAGWALLELIFRAADVEIRAGPTYQVRELFADMVNDVVRAPHLTVFAVLGVAWVVLWRYVARGTDVVAFIVPFVAALGVMFLTFDQTRIAALVTLPLLLTFWVFNADFLESLPDRAVLGSLGLWLVVPWIWVVGGHAQASVTPYSVRYALDRVAGVGDVPDDPYWPFFFDIPDAPPVEGSGSGEGEASGVIVGTDALVPGNGDSQSANQAADPGAGAGPVTPIDTQSARIAQERKIGFDHSVIDPQPPSGSDCCLDVLATGDVDGDGLLDVIVGSEHADGMSWYRNPGENARAGAWERFLVQPGDYTTDGDAADIDGDGDLDIIASDIGANVLAWIEQAGDPTETTSWIPHQIGPDFAHDLEIADLDGDGDLDVAAFHVDAARIDWFAQPDDPTAIWTQHVVADRGGEGLTAADVDLDGDIDLVAGPSVFTNTDGSGTAWDEIVLADVWEPRARSAVGDVDGDGVPDVVLSSPETEGGLSWFQGGDWSEHVIEEDAGYTHSLALGDVDLDGTTDLMVGVMEWAGTHEVRVLLGDGGATWTPIVLADTGTHNARLEDLDGDGHLDVVGKNFQGPKQLEVWWSRPFDPAPLRDLPTATGVTGLPEYRYVELDDSRSRFDDSTAFFGLDFGDVDGDDDDDIVGGGYLYLNPGDLDGDWTRVDLAQEVGTQVDAMLIADVDGDEHTDLIAESLPDVWWIEATGDGGWTGKIVAQLPPTSHTNGQGYRLGDLDGDGVDDVVLSSDYGQIWYLTVPASGKGWNAVRVTSEATDEEFGIGDIDHDGDYDVAAGSQVDGGLEIAWFENPTNGSPDWERHLVGAFSGVFPDRFDLVDLDGDDLLDVVVTAEDPSGGEGSDVAWYRQESPDRWTRSVIGTGHSMNGMDVGDMDGDGVPEVVTGELFGDKRVVVWQSSPSADGLSWTPHVVDAGHESHLGARVWDLDGDGDLEIVSIGWNDAQYLHLWIAE